jgi:putative SOS response-associated peptidase YedK
MTVLIERFQLDVNAARQLALFEPRYNIAPTQEILAVRVDAKSGKREPAMLRWGLVPSWSKEPQSGPPMINARGESIAEKPSFRTAVRRRRCLIPADGFYEWQKVGAGSAKKQPYYIHFDDHRPFAFAGLWETWSAKLSKVADAMSHGALDEPVHIESCTIVTTAASTALSEIYDLMPVILSPNDYERWLDPNVQDPAAIQYWVEPTDDPSIIAEPISTHVNKVSNDDPRCIQVQRALFD